MTMQQIIDPDGYVIDEYDDQQEGELIKHKPVEAPDNDESPPVSVNEQGEGFDEYDAEQPREQIKANIDEQQFASPPVPEPTNPFDANDVFIGITLHRANGHPQGRLVSVCIHNHSGVPTVRAFREQELSTESRFDNLQHAIQATMQPFLIALLQRKPEPPPSKPAALTPIPRPATTTIKATARPVPSSKAKEQARPQSNFEQASMF